MVAVGADKATHMKVTASLQLKGNSIMEPEKKVEAAQPAATPAPAAPAEAPKNVEAAEPQKPEAPQPAPAPAVAVEAVAQAAVQVERDRVGMIQGRLQRRVPGDRGEGHLRGLEQGTGQRGRACRLPRQAAHGRRERHDQEGELHDREKARGRAFAPRGDRRRHARQGNGRGDCRGRSERRGHAARRHPRRVHEARGHGAAPHLRQRRHQGRVLHGVAPRHPLERRQQEAHAGLRGAAHHRHEALHHRRPHRLQGEPALPPHRHRRPQARRRGRRDQGRRALRGVREEPARDLRPRSPRRTSSRPMPRSSASRAR